METGYLPKVASLGKKNETGHSLLFDSAFTETVTRRNAYEERLLLHRTEVIEREKQQTLRKLNFYRNQFLMRNFSVVIRQKSLQQDLLIQPCEMTSLYDQKKVVKHTPSSHYPTRSKTSSVAEKLGVRRTVSEPTFPALRENMNDILNGYRTPRMPTQPGTATSKTSFEIRRNFQSSSKRYNYTEPDKTSRLSTFEYFDNVNQMQRPKSNGSDSMVEKESIVYGLSDVKFSNKFLTTNCEHTNHLCSLKQLLGKANISNVESSKNNFGLSELNGEYVRRAQEVLNASLKNNLESADTLKLGNEVYILSDMKVRQRQEAQRIRVMRTVLLAYDTILNKRFQRISKA